MTISKDLIAASATPLILSILSQGESYGYAIIKRVHDLSQGQLNWTDGMLYPVLHRLENQNLIESRNHIAENGRMRKYYRIKDQGKEALQEHKQQWAVVYAAFKQIGEVNPCFS